MLWLILTSALLLVLIALLLWRMKRAWSDPVRELSRLAGRLAAGQWDARAGARGSGEVRDLSEKLNLVASRVERQLAELLTQRGDLRALVDSLPDPILLLDANLQLVLINAPAARLLRLLAPEVIGQPLAEVVSDQSLRQLIESISGSTERVQQRELRFTRQGQTMTFDAVATRTNADGTLLVLRNISAISSAVQMKTDFVANASHELRTPIAAIKIAFETLQEVYHEDPQQTARCIDIIAGHLRRLEEMLTDLLDLSRVESGGIKPVLGPVQTSDLFATLRSTMEPLARQKDVELLLGAREFDDPASEPVEFESDKRLLDLVLKNLVENSLNHTPAGGRVTVTVESLRKGSVVALRVSDTGVGIAAEHLDRVFERFYQADQSRSGRAGRGTGLGLAIVKHAINALDGEVQLSSQVNLGTTVTCTIPLRAPTAHRTATHET